eukprot:1874199-Rhodomonas_salina.1
MAAGRASGPEESQCVLRKQAQSSDASCWSRKAAHLLSPFSAPLYVLLYLCRLFHDMRCSQRRELACAPLSAGGAGEHAGSTCVLEHGVASAGRGWGLKGVKEMAVRARTLGASQRCAGRQGGGEGQG